MDIPSLFMIPSAVSSGKVHSVFPNSTDADFDFNRDSDATRVNSQGLIETVGYFSNEKVSSIENSTFPFNTFTDNGGGSYTCISTNTTFAGFRQPASERFAVTSGQVYRVSFDYVLNSGSTFQFFIGDDAVGSSFSGSPITISASGSYSFDLTIATTNSQARFVSQTNQIVNFTISNISVKEIQGDRARLNYEIEGGLVNTKPSLLLEPQSTNLITYSEDYSQSDWVKSKSGSNSSLPTVTDDYATSPDGSVNASRIQFNCGSTSSSDYAHIHQNIALNGSSSYTLSFYIKSNTSVNQSLLFFTQSTFGESITATTEWQRVQTTFTSNSTNARNFGLLARGSVQQEVDILIYGGQLEQQSYATSYIPTNGSTQTRAAETCNGAGTSSILPSEEGILYAEIAALANDGTYRELGMSGGSTLNRVLISYTNTSNQVRFQVKSSNSEQAAIFSTASYNVTDFLKIAAKYKANDFKLYINGALIGTDTSGAAPIGLSEFSLDSGSGGDIFYGKIRDIRVYNTKEMTDSEVDILLTKITS